MTWILLRTPGAAAMRSSPVTRTAPVSSARAGPAGHPGLPAVGQRPAKVAGGLGLRSGLRAGHSRLLAIFSYQDEAVGYLTGSARLLARSQLWLSQAHAEWRSWQRAVSALR
jgi:hypothetical protein